MDRVFVVVLVVVLAVGRGRGGARGAERGAEVSLEGAGHVGGDGCSRTRSRVLYSAGVPSEPVVVPARLVRRRRRSGGLMCLVRGPGTGSAQRRAVLFRTGRDTKHG